MGQDADGWVIEAAQATVSIAGTPLVAPVTLRLARARALALVGPNGSGKTTTLRMLAGVTRPSRGSVRVLGAEPDERDPSFRAEVAGLLGPQATARNLTLSEHLTLVATSWGVVPEAADERAATMLDTFGITRLADRYPHELSSGQTQLYSLALTLIRPCSVLLLDEPEQRLDPDRLDLVGSVLTERKASGTTLVFASHRQGLVEVLADEVLTLTEPEDEPADLERADLPDDRDG